MSVQKSIALLVTVTIAVWGCAQTNATRELDAKVQAEPVQPYMQTREDVTERVNLIPNLNAEQRKKLTDLQVEARRELIGLNQLSQKLRSLLIKDITAAKYNPTEIDAIKGRLRAVEQNRLNVLFQVADRANEIMGRESQGRETAVRDFVGFSLETPGE